MNQPPAKLCLPEPGLNRPAPGKLNDLRRRFELAAQQNPSGSRAPQEFGLSFGGGGAGAGRPARPSSLVVVSSSFHSSSSSGSSSSSSCHADGQQAGPAGRATAATTTTTSTTAAATDASNEPADVGQQRNRAAAAVLVRQPQPAAAAAATATAGASGVSSAAAAARRSHFAAEAAAAAAGSGGSFEEEEEAHAELPKPAAAPHPADCCSGVSSGDCDGGNEPQDMLRHDAVVRRMPAGSAEQRPHEAPMRRPPASADATAGGSGDGAAASAAVELPPSGTVAMTSRLFEKKPTAGAVDGHGPAVVASSQTRDVQPGGTAGSAAAAAAAAAVRRAEINGSLPAAASQPEPAAAAAVSRKPDWQHRGPAAAAPAAAAAAALLATKAPSRDRGEPVDRPSAASASSQRQESVLEEDRANDAATAKQLAPNWSQSTAADAAGGWMGAANGKPPLAAGVASIATSAPPRGGGHQVLPSTRPDFGAKDPAKNHEECPRGDGGAAAVPAHRRGSPASLPVQPAAAARPPKPPRTFEHDVYVQTKVGVPIVAGSGGVRTVAARPKSVAEFGHSSAADEHDDEGEAVYDDVVFTGGLPSLNASRREGGADDSLPPPLPQRPLSHLVGQGHQGSNGATRALSEGDDTSPSGSGPTGTRGPSAGESGLAGAAASSTGDSRRPNAKKAAPRNLREVLFAKSKAVGPAAAGGMKRYASEECLSTAAKADKGGGRSRQHMGSRWPTIDEAGYAVPQVNGKAAALDDARDGPSRERRKGAKSSAAVADSNGMHRAGSHGDVSRAGLGDGPLPPPKNAAQLDIARIHTKLNGAFSLLGADRRSYPSSFEDDISFDDGQDAGADGEGENSMRLRKKLGQVKEQIRDGDTYDDEGTAAPDQEVLQKWLKHCISVKQYSVYASANKVREFAGKAYPQLYQYTLIVSLRKNAETSQYEPYVLFKFPPHVDLETTGVPQFCFPDAQGWQRVTEYRSETFTFVLTEGTGTRQYGYCRRLLPPSKGNVPRIPEVVCLVSPLSAFKFYLQVLDEIERRRKISTAEEFLQAAYGKPLPRPGETVAIRAMMDVALMPWKNRYGMQDDCLDETELVTFSRAEDARIDGISYEQLLRTLTAKQIVTCFGAILLERKIVFCAEKLSTLSSCVNALVSLVYPFAWQHTFVPVLPPSMIEVACSPTPFIIGLLSSNLDRLLSLEMDEVLIVNLDSQKFIVSVGDEAEILPKQLQKALCLALDLAKADSKWRDTFVAETFLRFFFETVGNLSEFFVELEDGEKVFEKERLISAACDGSRAFLMGFLEWFTETQMFDVYVTERLSDPQPKLTAYDEKYVEWSKETFSSSDQVPVPRSFFKSIISRARIRK